MQETHFRKRIFYLTFIAKIATLLFLLFEWQTGGYSTSEVLLIIPIIMPLFMAYTTVLFKEIVQKKPSTNPQEKQISKGFVWFTYSLFVLYFLVIAWSLTLVPRDIIDRANLAQLQTVLAAIETGFGAYISPLIFTFKNDSNA